MTIYLRKSGVVRVSCTVVAMQCRCCCRCCPDASKDQPWWSSTAMSNNSACLKCGKCPGFSPQYYLKHKCMHCYCGVVHHRGIPQLTVPASQYKSTANGSSRHLTVSPDADDPLTPGAEVDPKKLANAGVPSSPFVWTRHTRRSRSQVRRCTGIMLLYCCASPG